MRNFCRVKLYNKFHMGKYVRSENTVCLFLYLGVVRPSQELLEFYRTKFIEYDNEYDGLVQKLDKYRTAYEQVVRSSI